MANAVPSGPCSNEPGDLVSDLVLYLPLALVHGMSTPGLIAAVLAGLLVPFVCDVWIGELVFWKGEREEVMRELETWLCPQHGIPSS
jgi:hypothetical protein